MEHGGGPDAEIGGFFGIYTVTNRDDGVEFVEIDFTRYLAFALCSNLEVFLPGSFFIKFISIINIG